MSEVAEVDADFLLQQMTSVTNELVQLCLQCNSVDEDLQAKIDELSRQMDSNSSLVVDMFHQSSLEAQELSEKLKAVVAENESL